MKSTHNTARAYGKSAIAMVCMVTGTAVLMAACTTAKPPAKEYSQDRLVDSMRTCWQRGGAGNHRRGRAQLRVPQKRDQPERSGLGTGQPQGRFD